MELNNRRGPLIVAEGVAANLIFGTLFVWSVLRNPLLEMFPTWNEGMLSIVFGLHNFFVCAGVFLAGWLCKRFPARRVFFISMLCATAGLAGFKFLPTGNPTLAYAMTFTLFCVFTATGIGVGLNVVQSTTIPWFPEKSGTVSGALYMALGVSSVFLAWLAEWLRPMIGVLNLMLVYAGIILLITLLILCDRKSVTAPAVTETTGAVELTGVGPKEMLCSMGFRVLITWNIAIRAAGFALLDHASPMAVAFGGSAVAAMLIAPANGLGSTIVGAALDRLGTKKIITGAAFLMVAAGALLCLGTASDGSYLLILIGLLLGGFAYGGSNSTYVACVQNRFGRKFYTQNFAVSHIAMGVAALLESGSGALLDVSKAAWEAEGVAAETAHGGSYNTLMLVVLGLGVIALVCALCSPFAHIKPIEEELRKNT